MNNEKRYQEFLSKTIVNVNGEISTSEDAKISIFDRGFLYGDSIYEVTYTEQGSIIFLNEHLDRLYNSANLLNMNIFLEKEEIIQQMLKTLAFSKIPRAYIRLILTRGESEISLDPNISFKNNFVIIVKPQPPYAERFYKEGLKLIISSVVRNDKKSVDPNAKSGNYLNNVMAINEAKKLDADDAIMVNKAGNITEGTTFNVWCIKDNIIYTPPLESGLLKGITREKVLDICKRDKMEHKVEKISPDFIKSCDEAFITSTTKGLMPIAKIDDKVFNPAKRLIYAKLTGKYLELIDQQIKNNDYRYL